MPSDSAIISWEQTAQRLTSASKPLLLTHVRADGDALGSVRALQELLRQQGQDPLAVLFEPVPESYAFLGEPGDVHVLGVDVSESDLNACDLIVLLDTCSYGQLHPVEDWLRSATCPKLAIDHHMTRDDAADNYLVDGTASATCLLLYEFATQVGWSLSQRVCQALFVGIATDTGWFCHSNTDSRTLAAVSDMVRDGLKPHELHQRLFMQDSLGSLRVLGPAIDSLSMFCDDRVAIMALSGEALESAHADTRDTEGLVNEALRVATVLVSVLLVEMSPGTVKGSFRSKPPAGSSDPDIDVAALAATFGGGGHKRAAGARFQGSLAEARTQIVESISKLLSA